MELINEILKWSLACVLVIQAYILIFNRGVPNIKTAKACRRLIAETLKHDFNQRNIKNPTIIDLGSGKGALTIEVATTLPEAQIIGYEFSAPSIRHAEKKTKKVDLTNIEYRKEDFLKTDLSHADAIIFFLNAESMSLVTNKLKETDFKPGTLILSNRFALHNWEPHDVLETTTLAFKQGKLFVYRV